MASLSIPTKRKLANHRSAAIEVTTLRNGYFPASFRWGSDNFAVQAVEACWTESARALFWEVQRHYFRVRTNAGVYVLCHHVSADKNNTAGSWTCKVG